MVMSSRPPDLVTLLQDPTDKTVNVLRKHGSRHNWHTTLVAMSIQGTMSHILRSRTLYVCQSWETDHSSLCSLQLDRLPAKALERVLHFLPLRSRISVSRTCRNLRSYLLDAPHLWAKVNVGPSRDVSYREVELGPVRAHRELLGARKVLERGSASPTEASASFDPRCLHNSSTLACLQAILRDTTTVRLLPYAAEPFEFGSPLGHPINNSLGPVSPRTWPVFAEALCIPSPSLRSLEIVIPTSLDFWSYVPGDTTLVLSDDTLGGTPALLRSCHLSGITLRSVVAALRSLTSFDYQPPDEVSVESVLLILRDMPSLETLGLCLRLQDPETVASLVVLQPRAWHQSLNRVALASARTFWAPSHPEEIALLVPLFKHICAKPDVTIAVDLRLELGPYFARPLPWLAGLADRPEEVFATHRMTVFRDSRMTVLGCSRTFNRDWVTHGSATFSNLVRLVIGEFRWPELAALSGTIPKLKSLCITLATSYALPSLLYQPCDEPGLFTSAALQPPLDCPSLEDVEIAAERDRHFGQKCILVLSLTDVCHFIRTGLRISSPRLRTLVLSGVSATSDPDPVAAFIAFQQLADEVSVRETISPDLRRLNALSEQRNFGRTWAPSHIFAPEKVASSQASDLFDHVGAP